MSRLLIRQTVPYFRGSRSVIGSRGLQKVVAIDLNFGNADVISETESNSGEYRECSYIWLGVGDDIPPKHVLLGIASPGQNSPLLLYIDERYR